MNIYITTQKHPLHHRTSYIWPLLKGLNKNGHQVTVLTFDHPLKQTSTEKDGIKIHYLFDENPKRQTPFSTLITSKISQDIKLTKIDLIHSLDDSSLYAAQKFFKQIAFTFDISATEIAQIFSRIGLIKRTISSYLMSSANIAYKFLSTYYLKDKKLLNHADAVFVINTKQKLVLERYYLYPESRIFTIPYGFDFKHFEIKEKSSELLKELNLPEDAQTVVTVLSKKDITEMKLILRAFSKIAVKVRNARLIILGTSPLRREVEKESLNLVLGNRVIFTGNIESENIEKYIVASDVYLDLSSQTTGFELNQLEAMAQKKIIIGSEVSAIAHIIEDGSDGFLIRPSDEKSLETLLLKIFLNEIPKTEIGHRARLKVTNLFDTDKMVDQTINAYKKILERKFKLYVQDANP